MADNTDTTAKEWANAELSVDRTLPAGSREVGKSVVESARRVKCP